MIEPTGYTKEHRCDAPVDCYTTGEVVERLGVSARQLQWWDEHKYASPLHHAHMRYWRKQDYAEAAILLELRERGITPGRVRKLRKRFHIEYKGLITLLVSDYPGAHIVVASPIFFNFWPDAETALEAVSMRRGAVVFKISARIFAENYRRPKEEKRKHESAA